MACPEPERRPHAWVLTFWSIQFLVNIKSVGVPPIGHQVMITQGSVAELRFAAAYGCQGRIVAAVTFNQAKWLEFYQARIEEAASFPPTFRNVDAPAQREVVPAEFPPPGAVSHDLQIVLTGHFPSDHRWEDLSGANVAVGSVACRATQRIGRGRWVLMIRPSDLTMEEW